MQPFLGRQTTNGAVIASFSSITMRAPGTSATPKGSVTRHSFVSPPSGSISSAITSFWPDARWPSEAVKQTSLVLISDDCSVRPLAQYLVQGEEINCTCCWPFYTVSPGVNCCAVPAFGPGAAGAGGTCGFVDDCWANACGPTVRASATIAGVPNTLVFAAADACPNRLRKSSGSFRHGTVKTRGLLLMTLNTAAVKLLEPPDKPTDQKDPNPRTGRCKNKRAHRAHACRRFFL